MEKEDRAGTEDGGHDAAVMTLASMLQTATVKMRQKVRGAIQMQNEEIAAMVGSGP